MMKASIFSTHQLLLYYYRILITYTSGFFIYASDDKKYNVNHHLLIYTPYTCLINIKIIR